jgi:hypothetical protein
VYKFAPDVDLWIAYGSRDEVPTMFGYDYGRKRSVGSCQPGSPVALVPSEKFHPDWDSHHKQFENDDDTIAFSWQMMSAGHTLATLSARRRRS